MKKFYFWGLRGAPILNIKKILLQNGVLNPHRKFQHYSSIRKVFKNQWNDTTSGRLKPPSGGGGGDLISKIQKSIIQNVVPKQPRKFQHSSAIRIAQYNFFLLK